MRNLEKRLADLERKFRCDPIFLRMPDGSVEKIVVSSGDGLLELLLRSVHELATGGKLSREADLVRRSIGGTEKGGHMVELCRALLNSPTTDDPEVDAVG